MTADEAVAAAHRAANAAGRCNVAKGGWLAECGCVNVLRPPSEAVRAHRDAPAEAVYLTLRRDRQVAWADLEPRKRVAIEVFRATLLICDRLVPTVSQMAQAGSAPVAMESALEEVAGITDMETLR